jgi:SecD/SecF fusion protein
MSAELRKNAVISIAIAVVAMMLYIAVRFEMGFAVGAIASTIHDVLITAGIYLSLGHQWSAPMLASLLMIIGYSINDTVIIFDRIREELPKNPQKNLLSIIDYAIGVTLPRTILTSLTTFLAAISLYVFGSGVVKDLSLIFMIGIVVGTFSSIFIACPAFYWWHRGNRERLDKKILPFEER